jgi:hypothetical protein
VYYEGTLEDWCNIYFDYSMANPMYYAEHFYLLNNGNWEEVTNLVIPEGVTIIKAHAFVGFENVVSVTIPKSVKSISSYAFHNCDNIKTVIFDSEQIISSPVISDGTKELLQNVKTVLIDSSVTYINPYFKENFNYIDNTKVPNYIVYSDHEHDNNSTCEECGLVTTNIKINSAYVNLTQDINLIYRTTVPAGYENFYMIFTLNETEYKVSEYFIDENGRYCFAFKNIMPQYMANNICAKLFATINGEEVYVEQASYSIKQYCVNLLNKLEDNETNKATRNVLSDLLEYGAAVQVYRNYNIDNLVTKDVILSSTVFNTLDESYNKQAFIGEASEEIKWHSAGLYLENTMSVRLGFKVNLTENINKEDLKVVVSINGRTTIYNVSELEADADGVYRIYYRGVYAKEFNDVIEAYFLNKDVQIGNTLQYSVNTYIYKKQESSDEALVAIIKAIYNYGASTEEYDK